MNGRIVSNTGPLIALAMINQLDILRILFSEVIIPGAVHYEILEGGAVSRGVASYQNASWIQVRELSNHLEPLLCTVLDMGEASVIQLCQECKADMVLIDERKGRKVARDIYKMRVIGTAGILVQAKQQGIITSVSDALDEMRNGGYRIHNNIIEIALKKAGEI